MLARGLRLMQPDTHATTTAVFGLAGTGFALTRQGLTLVGANVHMFPVAILVLGTIHWRHLAGETTSAQAWCCVDVLTVHHTMILSVQWLAGLCH